ncbi:hypothetical protein AB1Y20_015971 [Prymnesium parvum]|uniref:ATP-dependent RNA helicase Ski2/MTR4 C-terminal domain-containing protein n=1 Tax=Prymnesium parvum TaxID=97485 RepID=A0AB34K020_PRYPA
MTDLTSKLSALPRGLQAAGASLLECIRAVSDEFAACQLASIDSDEISLNLEQGTARAVYTWATGGSFEAALAECPGTFEGSLVWHLRQLDELLKQLAQAAEVLGDLGLKRQLEACEVAIHRGIPFANSLYLEE